MRIGICDDEKEVRGTLCEISKAECPDAEIIEYRCGEELLAQKIQADILFLDIQMPGMDGMKAAQQLRMKNKDMIIVFVTAMDEYVFNAFDVGAFHYLVKPFSKNKFVRVLNKAVEEYGERSAGEEDNRQILIKIGGEHICINTKDIIYAEVYNRKIIIHKTDGDIEYYGRMSVLEKNAGINFFRCHRAYLVNMEYVVKYNAATIFMEKGTALMSKQKYPEFIKEFLKFNQRKG